jgi:hypothetical protein
MKPVLAVLSYVSLALSPALADDFRVFTSAQGVAIKAKLVGIANGQVTIVREDGRQFTLPVTALSAADQAFLKTAPAPAAVRPAGLKPSPGPNDKLSVEEVNSVAGQALFGETAQPVEGVAFAEVVGGGVECVVRKISLCPIKIRLGEVESRCFRTGKCSSNRESAGVGKRVE